MAFFGASSLINATIGGAIGGGIAAMNGYDTGGIIGGAVAGGAFGVLGGGRLGNFGGKMITRGTGGGLNAFARRYDSYTPLRSLERQWMRSSITRGRDWFRRSGNVQVNKWGSRAATLAGLGATSYIGSSMIGSNSGY